MTKKCCFFFEEDEFIELLEEGGYTAEFSLEGVFFERTADSNSDSEVEVYDFLSEKLGVEVTSVHIDDCEYLGIWVVYREKDTKLTEIQITTPNGEILGSYTVKNAKEEDLEKLKNMIETRFDFEGLTNEEIAKRVEINDAIWYHINTFIDANFERVEVEKLKINY
jgi:hypothetical protein